MTDLASIIARAAVGDTAKIFREELPIVDAAERRKSASISDKLKVRVFLHDGFIDRYSGDRLIFPGALLLLSERHSVEFPYHRNWKLGQCHPAYYEVYPTVDHVEPRARRGADVFENLVSTSQARNTAKSAQPLAALGWEIRPRGDLAAWDGLVGWFTEQRGAAGFSPQIERWWRALRGATGKK